MTELEQRLTNELQQAGQAIRRRIRSGWQGQVERLEEQVQQLAEQYEQERKAHMAGQVETLAVFMQKLGEHMTTLTDGYGRILQHVNNVIKALQRCCDGFNRAHSQ